MPAVSTELNDFIMPAATAARPPARWPGWLARFGQALFDARMRQAEREIARFIEAKGGRMTDDLERQIERHFV